MRINRVLPGKLPAMLLLPILAFSTLACAERSEFGEVMPSLAELEGEELALFLAPDGDLGPWTKITIKPDRAYRIERAANLETRYIEGYRGVLTEETSREIRARFRAFYPPQSDRLHIPNVPSGCVIAEDRIYSAEVLFGSIEDGRHVAVDPSCKAESAEAIVAAISATFAQFPQLAAQDATNSK